MFKTIARFTSLLVVIAGFAGQAQAAAGEGEIGTRAYTNHALPLYVGPGNNFRQYGLLPAGLEVRVDRCSGVWCQVHFDRERGYVFLYSLSFGRGANSILWPVHHYDHRPYDGWNLRHHRSRW